MKEWGLCAHSETIAVRLTDPRLPALGQVDIQVFKDR
jgi:hypothetical protein